MKPATNGTPAPAGNGSQPTNGNIDINEFTSDDVRLPASQKIYIETDGAHKMLVPFREISLSPSKGFDGAIEVNAPVRVYDTSGPWTDPDQKLSVREGLPPLRIEWIRSRGDVEETPAQREQGRNSNDDPGTFHNDRPVLRAKPGAAACVLSAARRAYYSTSLTSK